MRFPPPARFYAPLLVLVFGLTTTFLNYELNLSDALARNMKDVEAQADFTGERLARRSSKQFAHGEAISLSDDFASWAQEPWLKMAAMVDEKGVVIDDSDKLWAGHKAIKTPLAPAMNLAAIQWARHTGHMQDQSTDGTMLFGSYPFAMGDHGNGWALVIFDRANAMTQAREDADKQLRWAVIGTALVCLCLWAALHYGVAARLAHLAQVVRAFGEGKVNRVEAMKGGDEVRELSEAFANMTAQLGEREAERVRLEREVLEITERERRRIGQELHDGLGQQLTAASLMTNGIITALESAAPSLAPQAENLGRQLRESIAEVRALSHGLAPVALEEDGLMHALHDLAETTGRSAGVKCVFECPKPVRVQDLAMAGHLYRIAQEAVNNAVKHASPREIRIGLERQNGNLTIEVDDDGDGLPEHLSTRGIGLRVMKHRALLIGGSIEIGSPPAGGTRLACIVPTR